MPDTITPIETPSTAPPITPPATPPASYIGPDGTFTDGWQTNLVPEEFRGKPVYGKIGSAKDALRQIGYLDSMVGKKGVIVPGEGSNPTEIAEFRHAIGVPESADKYTYQPKADLTLVDMSQEAMKPALDAMHKAGFTQAHVNTALEQFTGFMVEMEKSVNEQNDKAVQEAEEKIAEFSGSAYDQRLHLANLAIDKLTADWKIERKAALFDPETGLINDPAHAELKPYLMDFLANMGQKMTEHRVIAGDVQAANMLTPDQCKARIAEIESAPGFILVDAKGQIMKDTGRMDQYKVLAAERDKLYRMMMPK